ncbi:MAG: glycosyltransferase [Defluviitaleaceae bacterium]|nr:glycosyltransferase [Defluviitaleaceae bacterium]MCL2239572.1 glycosyltransferase [Defluviitaleaceae bacterium]
MNPKISIIIPVYNAEKYLSKCLDSVLEQPLDSIEAICVDDGSTDGSPQILAEYAKRDSRIRVFHQLNQHAGVARNKGLENAEGTYVFFLDADDYLTEDAFTLAYTTAFEHDLDYIRTKSYQIDAVTGKLLMPGEHPSVNAYARTAARLQDYKKPFSFKDGFEQLFEGPNLTYPPWTGMYKRKFLEEENIKFHSLYCYNDHSFYFAVAIRAKRVMVVDAYAVYHRTNNHNSLYGNNLKRLDCAFKAFWIIAEESAFLPHNEYAMVLDAELAELFYNYNRAVKCGGEIANQANTLMCNFIKKFDVALVEANNICNQRYAWYPDYLLFRLHSTTITPDERKGLLEKLWGNSNIFLPMGDIADKQIILYGAGDSGIRIAKTLQTLQHCTIVKWVDKNWGNFSGLELNITNPETVNHTPFDYILIGISDKGIAMAVQSWLTMKMVPIEKILFIGGEL